MAQVSFTDLANGAPALDASDLNSRFNALKNLLNGGIGSDNIGTGVVTAAKLATDSVTTVKIEDGAVTGAKIAMTSDAQGDILYHNGTSYARLAAGTSGQFLQTQGTGANPQWVSVVTSDTSFPGSPSAGDQFYHTTWNKFFIYNGTVWHLMNLESAGAIDTATDTLANTTQDLVTVTFTPYTEEVIITAHFGGGFTGSGTSPDYLVELRRDGTNIGADARGEQTNAPQQSSGALTFRDTGLTPGTSYTWALTNVASGSTCTYYEKAITVSETN